MSLPALDRPLVLGAAVVYLAVLLAIGVWASRRTRGAKDFFIAGQRVGLLVTGLATMSAAFSGFVFLGGPGLTYRIGLAALWIVLPLGFSAGMLCWVLAGRLRRLAGDREIYTIPDVLAWRFGSRSAAGLAALAVVLGSVAYLGLQLVVLGVLLKMLFGVESLAWAMGIGFTVLVAYSMLGGMIAGVYTDVIQGGLMLLAACAVFVQALRVTGGWSEMTRSIAESPAFGPEFLEPLGRAPAFTAFGFFFVFGVGVLGQPHMLHKFFMLDDPRKLRFLPLILGGSQAVCVLVWLGIGLAVPALVARGSLAALSRPDDATPLFLLHHTPELLAGLTFAGVLAAIMSTADSFLNIASAALVRDLPKALGRPVVRELTRARAAVLLVAVAAAVLAYLYGGLIALLGTFAFGTFGAALAPALAVGLCWKGVTARAAVASIATGLVLTVALEFLARQAYFPALPRPPLPPGVLPSAVSLAASLSVLFVVSALTRRTEPAGVADAQLRAVLGD